MNRLAENAPRWSLRLNELCSGEADPIDAFRRAEAWRIVYFNLARYLRYHTARIGTLSPDDLSDIASQKTLELMRKVDNSSGPLVEMTPDRIPAFLSRVARNGLITFLKKVKREMAVEDGSEPDFHPRDPQNVSDPALMVESREYARSLGGCVNMLKERDRKLWFFRVFYEMSSNDIATHPHIQMSVSHVDVVLHRARRAVRDCMRARGHDTVSMPPGTFTALWEMMNSTGTASKEAM